MKKDTTLSEDAPTTPLNRVLGILEGVKSTNDGYKALCPAHDDHDPSLSVREDEENGQKKVLLNCFAGCEKKEILAKLGLEWGDLFSENGSNGSGRNIVSTYDYTSRDGDLLHQTVRKYPKKFCQRRPDVNGGWIWNLRGIEPVLYNLLGVDQAVLDEETVLVVEGEKDADRAQRDLGVIATTCPMGAQKWRESYTAALQGARVVLIPDNDLSGKKHMRKVAESLQGVAASVKIVDLPNLPEKGDLSDWLDAGGTPEAFQNLMENAPEFDSGHIGEEFDRNESLPVKSVSEVIAESGEGPEWKVQALLAKGNVTDLSGEAKFGGKTTFVAHMISRVIKGEDFMGYSTERSRVVYLSEQGNNFAEALKKAGLEDADGELFIVQHRDIRDIPWRDLISRAVGECRKRGADILVVDTFAAFSGIVGSEENNSGDIKAKMAPLKEAAQVHDLAVLYIRHAGKSGRARGSSQFEAEGDIILSLKRPEGNHAENVRDLDGIGRYDEVPRKVAIELTESGYVNRGSGDNVEFGKAVGAIREYLPSDQENAITQDVLFEAVEGGDL